jgi:hypothetical protein
MRMDDNENENADMVTRHGIRIAVVRIESQVYLSSSGQ